MSALTVLAMAMMGMGERAAVPNGVAEVQFELEYSGNPYDGVENDVRVTFDFGGEKRERIAFFDGAKWRARVRGDVGGEFTALAMRNGKMVGSGMRGKVGRKLEMGGGMIRIDGRRFVLEGGGDYYPLGCNLAWEAGGVGLPEMMEKFEGAGMNWIRVWSNHWDGKNPYWIEGDELPQLGWMLPKALDRWDMVVENAENRGLRMQFVLFHHGLFSRTVNPNWDQHPWNVKNGGFLAEPKLFFTDAKAKRLAKNWLRYAVARYGYSPSVMAWELFNEVEWVQQVNEDRDWSTVVAWHDEMADYLRSIDAEKHLVTTSSEMHETGLWKKMDYYQPHGYPPSVKSMMAGAEVKTDKPFFYGEFGPSGSEHRAGVRDGIWASILAGHSGAGSYWYWDLLGPQNIYPEFAMASSFLKKVDWVRTLAGVRADLDASADGVADLVLTPGRGWGETTRFEFDLSQGAGIDGLGEVSGYFNSQKGANQKLFSRPLTFRYDLDRGSRLTLAVGEVSKSGAALVVKVDGKEVVSETWAGQSENRRVDQKFVVDLPEGKHVVLIESVGSDWFTVASMVFEGMGSAVDAMGIRGEGAFAGRFVWMGKGVPGEVLVGGMGLKDGKATLERMDLDSGGWTKEEVTIKGGKLGLRMRSRDEVWLIRE